MSGDGLQLPLDPSAADLPLNPGALAAVPILDRAKLYDALGLRPEQRECAEHAVRLVIAKQYGRRYGR